MARGTGLPFQDTDAAVQVTPGANADAYSNAASWNQIAQAGAQLREAGVNAMEKDHHRARVGYLAEADTEITRRRIELRDQFERDPSGFDNAWVAYRDGKLSQAEPWAVPHLTARLGQEGNNGYGTILGERRATDRALDTRRITNLSNQSADEVIGAAMSGTLESPQGQASLIKFRSVLQAAVNAEMMTQDEADTRLQDITSRASAEVVVKSIGDTYRENRARGFEAGPAALREAEETLLRTQDPRLAGLSEEQRYAYYRKATAEIRALEAERKQDLGEARQASRDALFAINNGVRPSSESIDSITEQLQNAGGHADAARLRAAAARYEQLAAFGRRPLREQIRELENTATDAGAGFARPVNDAINQAATESGLSPSLLRRFARIESGGDPAAVTGSYRGLFQLSQAEFDKYGGGDIMNPVDNARAAGRKLAAEAQAFQTRHGRAATPLDLYMVHQQGEGGYAAHLANPTRAAWENMASTGEGRQRGEAWARQAIWGNIPDRDKRRFPGGVETVTSADFIGIWRRRVGGGEGEPDVRTVIGQRDRIGDSARTEWTRINTNMDAGIAPNPEELKAVIQAGVLTGDHKFLEDMAARLDRFDAARVAGRQPLETQQRNIAEFNTPDPENEALAFGPVPAGDAALLRDLQNTMAATRTKLEKDPISLGVERFEGRILPPAPFDLTNRDAARQGVTDRARIANFVGENYGQPNRPALTQADVTQLAGAIAGRDPAQAAAAFDVLASIPDANFAATLRLEGIKDAIGGAVRSNDPAKYTAAMQSLDRMWARAPQEMQRVLGDDVVKAVQDWQSHMRYSSPEELRERLTRRGDPQVAERHREMERQGRRLATKKTIDEVTTDLDPGLFQTGPDVPLDGRTRDAAMADYTTLFAERFAETNDKDKAHTQAIERMRLYWQRSEVNGGRLTLHAPETVYPAVGGSHAWMRTQITRDLRSMGVNTDTLRAPPVRSEFDRTQPTDVTDFSVVADRTTETDIANGRPPSYFVTARRSNGEIDLVRGTNGLPLRYFWTNEAGADARDAFARQRRNVFGITPDEPSTMSGAP